MPYFSEHAAQAFLEDAFGLRVWVEQEQCKQFVANLLTAFPADKRKAKADHNNQHNEQDAMEVDADEGDAGPRPG
eukprot:1177942-Prorocentrum_minimum.AAC.4